MSNARILDHHACRLGEGPSYEAGTDTLFWFDILGRQLLEHRFVNGKTLIHDLPFMASAIFSIDADRQLILAENGFHVRERATGALSLHTQVEADNPVTRSNDARSHPCGAIWFGTMGIDEESGAGAIYRFFKGEVRVLFPNFTVPNSICFSPDGRIAYFVDTPSNQLMRIDIDPQTALPVSEARLFYRHQGAGWIDGSICDADGNVWNARWGAGSLACLSPEAKQLQSISCPGSPQTSCPAFISGGRLAITSASKQMDAAALAAAPNAGKTFIADTSVKGRPEPAVLL